MKRLLIATLLCGHSLAWANLTLTPERQLTLAQVDSVAQQHEAVSLNAAAWANVRAGHEVVLQAALNNQAVYGLTVGVGWNKDHPVFEEHHGQRTLSPELLTLSRQFNQSSLRAHSAGLGEPLPEAVVRAAMLMRLNTFLNGEAGVSTAVAEQYIAFLNHGITPIVPSRGSVGEADITLAAHIGLAMIGEWDVWYQGKRQPASKVMAKLGIKPLQPIGKDFLSILSTNALMAAQAQQTLRSAQRLYQQELALFVLMLEGMNGNVAPFSHTAMQTRPFPAASAAAADIRHQLDDSDLWQTHPQRALQDPLSYRSMAYTLGEVRQAMSQLETALTLQINHSDDNPVVLIHGLNNADEGSQMRQYAVAGSHEGAIVPTANFNFLPVAQSAAQLNEALAKLAEIMTQQLIRMENPELTKLPRFLAAPNNHGHAFGAIQKPFVATNQHIKTLAQPLWFDSVTLAGSIEDTASMSNQTLANTQAIIDGVYEISAFQLLHGAQAVALRPDFTPSRSTQKLLKAYRQQVPFIEQDIAYTPLIEKSLRFWRSYQPH
ncbi:MAG: HAL/PAL/TAL family ammonia-lyase [Neisseriaceae bacterium]